MTKKEIAIKLATLRERYAATQRQRITILRTLSAGIGIAVAFALQINTFDILGSFFSADVAATLNSPVGQIGGIIITGLAASAGSSFWHDMLGRVRNIKDTVKQVDENGFVRQTLERSRLWAIQTPQAFPVKVLRKAYDESYKNSVYGTDDATLVERSGGRVRVLMGSYENIKIATPEDLILAEEILKRR